MTMLARAAKIVGLTESETALKDLRMLQQAGFASGQ